MSKRSNGHEDGERDDKRTKLDLEEDSNMIEQEAEWEALQRLLGESKNDTTSANGPTVDQKTTIELAAEADDEDPQDDEDDAAGTWNEDETNVERRMEEQVKRRAYLEKLRSERASKSAASQQLKQDTGTQSKEDSGDEDDGEEDEDEGWIRRP